MESEQQHEAKEKPTMNDQQLKAGGGGESDVTRDSLKGNRVSFNQEVTVQVLVVNDVNVPVETKNIRVSMSVFSGDDEIDESIVSPPAPTTESITTPIITESIDLPEQPKQPTEAMEPKQPSRRRPPPRAPPPQTIAPPPEDPPGLSTSQPQSQRPLLIAPPTEDPPGIIPVVSSQSQQRLVIAPPTEDPPALTTLESQQQQPQPQPQQPSIEIIIPTKSLQQEISEAAENLVTKGLLVALSRRYPGALQGIIYHPTHVYLHLRHLTPPLLPHLYRHSLMYMSTLSPFPFVFSLPHCTRLTLSSTLTVSSTMVQNDTVKTLKY